MKNGGRKKNGDRIDGEVLMADVFGLFKIKKKRIPIICWNNSVG